MIEVSKIEAYGFEAALRGMRNPMNSWDRSDSFHCMLECDECDATPSVCDSRIFANGFIIGKNDLDLVRRLYEAGREHRKYLRMIHCSMDIRAPIFWWMEFDTYRIGTTKNSCSKMHKIHVKEFNFSDFTTDGIEEVGGKFKKTFEDYLTTLEELRELFNETQEKKYWRALIEMLPEGYNMLATVDTNYEVVDNIYSQREFHKVFEWGELCAIWIRCLPYFAMFTCRGDYKEALNS